jgi:hypothetical protein
MLKNIEMKLLLLIYEYTHMKCNRVIEPYVECDVVFSDSGFGIEADKHIVTNAGLTQYNQSISYTQQIFSFDDIEKIEYAKITYFKEQTEKNLATLQEIFDGILPVRLFGRSQFNCTPLDDIMTYTSIEQGMMYLALQPELMHSLISRYIEVQIDGIKQYESLGIISSNNAFKNVGNTCIGYTSSLAPPTESGIGAKISDIWGENSDQIMTCVSKEMSEEFAFAHEITWASMFPIYSYGCCERLDNKIGSLLEYFPNIRKISCSPYSDLEATLEQSEGRTVISFKPNSNYLALGANADFDYLRDEIVEVCRLVEKYQTNVVLNMKTLITLQQQPWRLWQWCSMAQEIVTAHFG